MSYIIITVETQHLQRFLEDAELEGYGYVGSVGQSVIMQKQGGQRHLGLWTMTRIAEMLREAVDTDGGHHKQWYLEQIAEGLEVTLPDHEAGIAP